MIDDKAIDLWTFRNFASMENIRRKSIPIEDLLKFIFNKKILNKVVVLDNNQICAQTLYL